MVKTGQELTCEPEMGKTDEEKPYNYADPVQVGKEFIRQYYEVLNKCPQYLYRFYNHQSSFVHGGIEKPGQEDDVMRGQRAICEKIKSLNFVNSQVKIFQVDSQQSHGDTVVIQASGEINRDGVMRRFMQSFVLARVSSLSFCVYNDIFRYQDEDFSSEREQSSEEQQAAQEGTDSDMSEEAVDMPVMDASADPEMSHVDIVGDSPESSEAQSLPTMEQNEVDEEEQPAATKEEEKEEEEEEKEVEASSPVTEEEQKEEKEAEPQSPKAPEKPKEESSEPSVPQPAESVKTFSWAAMVSKNTTPAASTSEVPPVAAPPKPVAKAARKPSGAAANADAAKPPEPPKAQRTQKESRYSRERSNSSRGEERNGSNGNGGRNFSFGANYPDEQQLFVGNLPHSMSESELKTFFESFGNVLELRINTKGAGGRVPNFGFVVFDKMETAQNVLRQRPIYYNGQQRLNVEEKKTRGEYKPYGGRGGARYGQGPPRNYGSRGGYRGDSRPYNGDRQNGGREFYKRGASNAAARH